MEGRRFENRALRVMVLAAALCAAAGCGRNERITGPGTQAPEPAGSTAQSQGRAPVVDVSRLAIPRETSEAMLAPVLKAQAGATPELAGMNRDVVGTAASAVDGRPVLLALTRQATSGLPRTVQGVEVAELVVGEIRAQAYYCGTSTGRADECASGTLGAIVTDGTRNYWLSNWHVFVDRQGKVGDNICAPGRYDAGCGVTPNVGTLYRFTPLRFDGGNNTVDCAIARIIPGTSVSPIESAGSRSFLPKSTVSSASVGMAVKKVGRTTGFTTGSVVAVNATLNVNYGFGVARFVSAVLTSPMSQPGDSGSLICDSATNNPVALLFAGSSSVTVGCPIGAVLQAVGAHIASQ